MASSSLGNRSDKGQALFKDKTKAKKAKIDKKATQSPIHLSEHGRYQIKSGLLAGKFVARAFAKPPTLTRGLIAEASGTTEDAAITSLQEFIDKREAQRIQDRRVDSATGMSVPSVEEYAEALEQVALTRPQRAMLTALSLADADGLTDMVLANGAGYKSRISANRSLARAGGLIADFLVMKTDSKLKPIASEGISFLAFRGRPQGKADHGNWILFPELRDAVRAAM